MLSCESNFVVTTDSISEAHINPHSPLKNKRHSYWSTDVWLLVPVAGQFKFTCSFVALAAVDVGKVVVAALRLTHTALSGQVTPREHAGRVGWSHIFFSVSLPVLVSATL